MTAYSFKAMFRAPILAGTKRQTIRADRKRHARPGEQVQLYTGMRTRQCQIIGRAVCESVEAVRINLDDWVVELLFTGREYRTMRELDDFAERDGFPGWADMREFWRTEHSDTPVFSGVLIRWGALIDG